MDTTQLSPDATGLVAGQFLIRKKLGSGGMGEVYLADQLGVDRKVVLKLVHAHLLAGNPLMRERFEREARALAHLNHPNIVQLYTFGTTNEGRPYFAMEFVDGRSLTEELRQGRMEERRALTIAADIADALAHAHEAGVIHRDIKPDNIMLSRRHGNADFVTVLDFGIAKLAIEGGPNLTQTHASFGTPQYVAPEQATGQPVTAATDLYALGTMLFEMLTGQALFEGTTPFELISQHVTASPRAPSTVAAGISAATDAIVLRCLQKSPAARFDSATELAVVLRHAAAGGTVSTASARAGQTEGGGNAAIGGTRKLPNVPPPDEPFERSDREPTIRDRHRSRPRHDEPSQVPAAPSAIAHQSPRRAPILTILPLVLVGAAVTVGVALGGGPVATWHALTGGSRTNQTGGAGPPPPDRPVLAGGSVARDTPPPPVSPIVPATTAVKKVVLQRDAMDDVVDACLNQQAPAAWNSYYRYLSWVDPAKGPTGRERNIYGLSDLSSTANCSKPALKLDPTSSEGLVMTEYSTALASLASLTTEAHAYYEPKNWKDDGMAQGKKMHPRLMEAFTSYAAAYRKLISLVEQRADRRDEAALGNGPADSPAYQFVRLRFESRKLARAANVPWRQLKTVAPSSFDSQIDRTNSALNDLQQRGTSDSRVQALVKPGRDFLNAAQQLKRLLGARPHWSPGDRISLDDHIVQAGVTGSPAYVIDRYDRLVREMNRSRIAPGIEALEIHLEDPRR